jgi:hypothetical protein
MIKLADDIQMTVDGFGLQFLPHEIINVMRDRCMSDAFQRDVHPDDETLDGVQIIYNRIGRAVPSLQETSPVDHRIA